MENWRSLARQRSEAEPVTETDIAVPLCRFHFLENGEVVEKFARDIFKNRRVVVFGIPGAFTPTCSNSQVPDFEAAYDDIIAAGVDEVYCIGVNDPYVMDAWRKHLGVEKVKFIPDGNGFFTRQFGKSVFKSNVGFGVRSWRYAAVINCDTAEIVMAEEGQTDNCTEDPYENSTPARVLEYLREVPRVASIEEEYEDQDDLESLSRLERTLMLRKAQARQLQ
tara:strand:+ start:899 stop:1564 length:666 start_codon:yes stop_codon:yes gene_type:complete